MAVGSSPLSKSSFIFNCPWCFCTKSSIGRNRCWNIAAVEQSAYLGAIQEPSSASGRKPQGKLGSGRAAQFYLFIPEPIGRSPSRRGRCPGPHAPCHRMLQHASARFFSTFFLYQRLKPSTLIGSPAALFNYLSLSSTVIRGAPCHQRGGVVAIAGRGRAILHI